MMQMSSPGQACGTYQELPVIGCAMVDDKQCSVQQDLQVLMSELDAED